MYEGVTREEVVAIYKAYFVNYKIKLRGSGYETLYATSKEAAHLFTKTENWNVLTIPDFLDSITSISRDLPGVGVILDCMEQLGMLRQSEPRDELKIAFEEGPES